MGNNTSAAIDLVVEADYIVTMDPDNTILENGAIAIDDGVILAIGSQDEVKAQYSPRDTVRGDRRILLPGLVNGHLHAALSLFRGYSDDVELTAFLMEYMFPAEAEFVDPDYSRIGTELSCWEMIRGGTTTFVDMYFFPDAIAEAIERCGMRALVSSVVIAPKSPDTEEGVEDSINKATDFVKRWRGRHSRITPIFGPHSPYTNDAEGLVATRAAAKTLGTGINIHLSESRFEIDYTKENYGTTTIEALEELDFFDGPTIAAHVVWPTDEEIPILVDRKIGVIHNPSSNAKLASGISPVTRMLEAGVRVGLGTDGGPVNNDSDMWEEMRLAAFLQKVSQMDATALPAQTVLHMATRGCAEAIGLGDQVGSIEVGKRADVIQVALDGAHHVPNFDVISTLVYVVNSQDVVTTIVDGEILMRDREMLSIDTDRVRAEAEAFSERIQVAYDRRKV